MPLRKLVFETGSVYHLCNKSISNYEIFNNDYLKQLYLNLLEYCNNPDKILSFSILKKAKSVFVPKGVMHRRVNNYVDFISYCIMPDHYHILVKSNVDDYLLNNYIGRVQNSFTKTVNGMYKRKGPLWQSRFRAVEIMSSEQLLNTVRYININPCTKKYVDKPEDWVYSSMNYLSNQNNLTNIPEISIDNSSRFRKFITDRIDYQRKLHVIKRFILE
jgi:REP element-mobilizing transposase RayT